MKKILISFLIFNISFLIFSTNKINILIMPFKNNNPDNNIDIYSQLIIDKIKNDITKLPNKISVTDFTNDILNNLKEEEKNIILSIYEKDILEENYVLKNDIEAELLSKATNILIENGYKKFFIPFTLKDLSLDEQTDDYHKIYKSLIFKSIDLIICGYYYEKDNKIRITFKVIDLALDRAKIVYNNFGDSGEDTYDIIFFSINKLIEKMDKEIIPYSNKINAVLKDRQSRIISGEVKERMLLIETGITFCGKSTILGKRYLNTDYDLLAENNNFSYTINPAFNIEIYNSYKNNYHGFGLKFNIPVLFRLPNLQFVNRFSLSYILGFKKEFFFDFSLGIFTNVFYKFNNNNENKIEIQYIGFYIGFNFKYMPKKYPLYIEAGFFLLPLKVNNADTIDGFPFWTIKTDRYKSAQNWISPVILNLGIGVFIKKDFGLFLRNKLYFMYIEYYKENETRYKKYYTYYGDDLSINYEIEIGMMFKIIF